MTKKIVLNYILFCFVLLAIIFNTPKHYLIKRVSSIFSCVSLALSYLSSTVVLKRGCGLLC